jgi:Ca2+/Na+ antiporter
MSLSSSTCPYHWGENGDLLGPLGIDYYYLYECSPHAVAFCLLVLMSLWVVLLMNLLAQTASDYFSPTLSKICENMNLAYDIAGVTLLALGNGAPDFFSLIASFSGGVDVLVGVGALLGGGMFVCTIVVGSIGILCPCQVSRTLFLRDIGFHLISVTSVGLIGLKGEVTVGYAVGLLLMYFGYVGAVLMGSWCTSNNNDSADPVDPLLGDIGMHSLLTPSPSAAAIQTAFWHPSAMSSTINKQDIVSPLNNSSHNLNHNNIKTVSTPYSFVILQEDCDDFSKDLSTQDSLENGSNGRDATINLSGVFSPEFTSIIKEDFFAADDDNRHYQEHFDASHGPSEDSLDNSPETSSQRINVFQTRLHKYSELLNRNATKYQNVLSALYWQQWALSSQFRHSQIHRDWDTFTWYYKLFVCLQYPLVFLRDITIPDLDPTRWNKLFAVLHPLADPVFALFVVGQWGSGVGVLPSSVFCLLIGVPPAVYVFLYSTTGRAPPHRLFVPVWSVLAFSMNILWIYMLAGELINCLSVLGLILDIPAAFLGLTVLAWGNSIGDFFTNTAVAKQGLGAMAVAGCYGGPVFNILIGLGSSLLFATTQSYPSPFIVQLDISSIVSLTFLCLTLVSTMIIIPLRNYQLDQVFGVFLITLYTIYTMVQAIIVMWA